MNLPLNQIGHLARYTPSLILCQNHESLIFSSYKNLTCSYFNLKFKSFDDEFFGQPLVFRF